MHRNYRQGTAADNWWNLHRILRTVVSLRSLVRSAGTCTALDVKVRRRTEGAWVRQV